MPKPQIALVTSHLWKEFLWQIWMLRKLLSNFWVVATMKVWGHIGRRLLFLLPTHSYTFWKLPNLGSVLHQHTAVGCLTQKTLLLQRCFFSLTLPLPRFSVIFFLMGLSVNNHHPHEIFQLLLKLFGDQGPKAIVFPLWGKNSRAGARLGGSTSQGKIQAKDASGSSVAERGWLLGWSADMEVLPALLLFISLLVLFVDFRTCFQVIFIWSKGKGPKLSVRSCNFSPDQKVMRSTGYIPSVLQCCITHLKNNQTNQTSLLR